MKKPSPGDTPTPGSPKGSKFSDLRHLAESFKGFEQQLKETKERKKSSEEKKLIDIKNDLMKIAQSVTLESKRRSECLRALERMFKDDVEELRKDIETPIDEKLQQILTDLTGLTNAVDNLDSKIAADRKAFPAAIEKHSSNLTKNIEEFKAKFESDSVQRQEKQKVIEKTLKEQDYRVQQQLEAERVGRAQKISQLVDAIDTESRCRKKSAAVLNEQLKDEIKKLSLALEEAEKERKQSTEEIVKTFVHYTAALQDGVKIISHA